MQKSEIIEKMQNLVNDEFDKILKIKVGDNEYRIAIRKDQIPKISHLDISNNNIKISFDGLNTNETTSGVFELVKDLNGEIRQVTINDADKLKNESYRYKLNRELLSQIKNIPEGDLNQSINKNKQKRVAHALAEIMRSFSNGELLASPIVST